MIKRLLGVIAGVVCLSTAVIADSWLSWAEFDRDGENIQIYLSRDFGGETGPVTKVTQRGMNLAPSVMETEDSLWLAWVDRSNRFDYRLQYARLDPDTLNIVESGTIATSDRKTYGPSLGLSPRGTPMLAWSGLDGKDEEIRLAEFNQGRWGPEQRITNNDFPDTLPRFSRSDEGETLLSWEQLNREGIFTAVYTIPQGTGAAQGENTVSLLSAAEAGQQIAAATTNLTQLPASLSARQERFLMGSRAPTYN